MKLIALGAFVLATLSSGAASAQAQQPNITHGAPVTGVCVYHVDRMLAQSTAGQSLQTGMRRLAEQVRSQLAPYPATLQQEQQSLAGQVQQLQASGGQPSDALRQQAAAFEQRTQEYQQLQGRLSNELEYTQMMQRQALFQASDPVVTAVYQDKGCAIIVERSAVYLVNPAMDITDEVIRRLNTSFPALPQFELMPVPVQQQQ